VPQPDSPVYEPRRPGLLAALIFVLAALTLCAPMLAGRFLLGDDQLLVGYGFRAFGAEFFRETGSIPQWNPYQFGGMPFIAAMHGDIFYPTAWLRWLLPIDLAMNLGWMIHFVLAGAFMYLFCRALALSWTAAIVGGVAYELSGILASLANPGHDGKLYVSALAPLAFFALLRAVRDRRLWGYGLLALVVGLGLLSPHYQMTYYLLVALGMWALYLVFFDPDRPSDLRWPVALGLSLAAIVLGLGISGLQALPFLEYIPFSPRGAGGPSAGWDYATSYSFPIKELPTAILPEFNGIQENYWGGNFLKSHSEYLGASVVILAILAFGARERKRLMIGLGVIALLFLFIAFGRHFPFYRLWYEVMPMMKKVRAPGMAFFLVAMVVSVYAAIGVERLLRAEVRWRRVGIAAGVLGGIAVLGVAGGLQTVAEVLVQPEQASRLSANAPFLRSGALRLLLAVGAASLVLWLIESRRLRGMAASLVLAAVVIADLWSVDRRFFPYHPPAAELFRVDPVIERLKQTPEPFRVFDTGPWSPQQRGQPFILYSSMMAHRISSMLGYHGNEVRFYDDLMGGKNEWRHALNLNLWDLLAVRYLIVADSQPIPGFHIVLGPATTAGNTSVYLYEQDSVQPYVRVVAAAAKIPEAQVVPTVNDPRFPITSVVLFADTASVTPDPIEGSFVPPPPVTAVLAEWAPGRMRIGLTGTAPRQTYLVISETWYPDWRATVDGQPATVHRGDHALLTVVLPPGAREVNLVFHDDGYTMGKVVTAISALLTLGLVLVPAIRRRKGAGAGV
jgi:hypothetical protein